MDVLYSIVLRGGLKQKFTFDILKNRDTSPPPQDFLCAGNINHQEKTKGKRCMLYVCRSLNVFIRNTLPGLPMLDGNKSQGASRIFKWFHTNFMNWLGRGNRWQPVHGQKSLKEELNISILVKFQFSSMQSYQIFDPNWT